jgi:hypothetical protein
MRFLVDPTPERLQRARAPVRAFLAFAALAVVALVARRWTDGGLSAGGVEAHYLGPLGDERLPWVALFEELHAAAFLYGLVVFMVGSLLVVCPLHARWRAALFAAAVTAPAADLASPFLVVALGGGGVVRVATSLLAAAALAAGLVAVALTFGRPGRLRG